MTVEVFANIGAATVTSGGITAPAPGTVEAWTVNVTGAFPVASTSATPPTQFHGADPVAPSETFKVTVCSGGTGSQSWTVTRGVDGTTPVAHAAGFTVEQVVSKGWLAAVAWAATGGQASNIAVLTLTDAATVALHAVLGNDFRLTTTSGVGATREIGTPSNPVNGQQVSVTIIQDSVGDRLVTWSPAWQFPGGNVPILSTAPGFSDILKFTYYSGPGVWMLTDFIPGLPGTSTTVFWDDFGTIPSGDFPDAAKWGIALGSPYDDPTAGSQWYQNNPNNVYVNSSGNLVLACTVNGGGTTTTGARGNYISGRISTFQEYTAPNPGGLGGDRTWTQVREGFIPFQATYGTFTVKAKVASTAGFWPAIWCFGTSQLWPACGEIDLMENFGGYAGNGSTLTQGYGNVIGPRNPNDYVSFGWDDASLINHTPASGTGYPINDGNFHTYVMSLNSAYNSISFTIDGAAYGSSPITETAWLAAATSAGASAPIWPFGPQQPLGIVLNVCVGSTVSSVPMGYPSNAQTFPLDVLEVESVEWTIP